MKKFLQDLILVAVVFLAGVCSAIIFSGCQAVNGLGKDIQSLTQPYCRDQEQKSIENPY